jgi:A/G-specific adenine glycosylase
MKKKTRGQGDKGTRGQGERQALLSPCPLVPLSPCPRNLPSRLLRWFAGHQRDLPWRRDRDPYRIWISEVMLQQTQVVTVIPYFERFLQTFPTIAALAAAAEQDVLRLWAGLGYYRRARDLHRSAQILAKEHDGQFPTDPVLVRRLPGFGLYTCNAVLSQAFDQRLPILEANSQRVLSRLFGRRDDPRAGPARRWLWQAAERILPKHRAGEFNQALMELGALVCTPVAPRCGECPLASMCEAKRLGLQEQIPARTPPPATIRVREAAVVVRRGEQVLLVQRPESGRWATMWEFPHVELKEDETHEAAAERCLRELVGVGAEVGGEIMTIQHGVTRYAITMVCLEARYLEGEFRSAFYSRGVWLTLAELSAYPVSAPQRRLIRELTRPNRQPGLF